MRPSCCLLLLLALGACAVQGHVFTARIEKDERALVPISNAFGFGSRGHIDVTITNVAIYRRNDADDADLSKFGLFLSPWEAELDLEADMLAGKCLLDDRELTLFRFSEKNVKAVKAGQLNNVTFHVDVNNGGRFFLYFASCESVTPVSFKAHVEMYNLVGPSGKKSYLSVGETELSVMYWVMFGLFALATCLWGYVLRTQRSVVQNIHWLMLALVVLKTLTVFAEALMYHFINIHGRPDGWNIVYYILTAGRGLLFFVVVILIGTGWSYMRPFLDDNTKRVLLVVLPLQVFANIAIIITNEESPAVKDWYTWRNIFHIVDVLCCCAILFPIVWSIKRLRDACEADGKSDGKAARSLEKLVLFRQFYIVVVMFIYFTRIVVFLLESTVDYQYQWTAAAAAELATLMFYTWMGVKFRPFQENAYLKLRQEEIEMG